MVRSMTGFGRCESADGPRKVTAEIKSVNHRYLDISVKLPKKLYPFESGVRSILQEYMERGKADIYISYEDSGKDAGKLRYNEALAAEYVRCVRRMAEEFSLPVSLCASQLAGYPEVVTVEPEEEDEGELWHLLESAVRGAAEKFLAMREREGERLRADIQGKLGQMEGRVSKIEERAPGVLAEYRQRLTDKVNELLADAQADESRIVAETAIYADKICTDEEIVRLKSHIRAMEDSLQKGGSVGRKLDFIAQEMNREANTILSKSNDIQVSGVAIELKTDIEKIREQVQNVE